MTPGFIVEFFGRTLIVEKRRAASIAFFRQNDLKACRFSLILQHLNEFGKRNLHEMLTRLFAKGYFLLLAFILANHQSRNFIAVTDFDDFFAGLM